MYYPPYTTMKKEDYLPSEYREEEKGKGMGLGGEIGRVCWKGKGLRLAAYGPWVGIDNVRLS